MPYLLFATGFKHYYTAFINAKRLWLSQKIMPRLTECVMIGMVVELGVGS